MSFRGLLADHFDRTDRIDADVVRKLTKSDLLEFYETKIKPGSPSRRKLVVYMVAQGFDGAKDGEIKDGAVIGERGGGLDVSQRTVIEDGRAFRASMPVTEAMRPVKSLHEFESPEAKL